MPKHAARPHARRRRLSFGVAAVLGISVVAVLAAAPGAVPDLTPSADEVPGALSDADAKALAAKKLATKQESAAAQHPASRGLDRDNLTTTVPRYKVKQGHTFKLKPEVRQRIERALHPTVFRVSTFNVLGAGHTGKGGNKKGWAGGVTRMHWAVDLLRSASIDVVGFQEFQPPQYGVFRQTMPGWGVYPGGQLSRGSMADSIAWDEGQWDLVEARTIDIPYFGGHPVAMPYVLLRNVSSGQKIWFANFHNPADAHGPAARFRARALSLQIALANNLHADGTPVIFTGDMNDREEYFCPMTANTDMHAANGGSVGAGCSTPDHMDVDWIFGSSELDFANFVSDNSHFVSKTTDHPFVWAEATLD